MEKIALGVLHEVELHSNTDLDEFEAELFLKNKQFSLAFELKREKKGSSTFTFTIPESLQEFLKDPVDYKIYVYLDNARFLADKGKLQVISNEQFTGSTLKNPVSDQEEVKFSAKIKSDDTKPKEEEKKPEKETKPKEEKKDPPKKAEPTKSDKKEEKPKKEEKKSDTKKTTKESINIDEILEQHGNINEVLKDKTGAKGKSLREYADRIHKRNELSKNKDELNSKVKNILQNFKNS